MKIYVAFERWRFFPAFIEFIYLFVSFPVTALSSSSALAIAIGLALSLFMINFRFVLLLLVFCVCSSAVCFYWFVCNFLFRFINHLIVNQLYTIYFLLMLSICVWAGVKTKTKTKCVYEKPKIGIKKRWLEPDPFPYVCINPFPISFYFSLYFLCLFLLFVVRFYFWIFLLFCKMFVAHTHTSKHNHFNFVNGFILSGICLGCIWSPLSKFDFTDLAGRWYRIVSDRVRTQNNVLFRVWKSTLVALMGPG